MEFGSVGQIVAPLATGFAAALLALTAMQRSKDGAIAGSGQRPAAPLPDEGVVFLFRGQDLVDATGSARLLLARGYPGHTDLARVLAMFQSRFPSLSEKLTELSGRCRLDLPAQDGTARIEAEWCSGYARLRLIEVGCGEQPTMIDGLGLNALTVELDDLRAMAGRGRVPMWRTGSDGSISWANAAYLDLADKLSDSSDVPIWPPRDLFDSLPQTKADAENGVRLSVQIPGEPDLRWFMCEADSVDGDVVYTALPDDAAVRAEESLSSFVQTLSNTFAHLTAGLAIFDRHRHLTLFNPALSDLTDLPSEFLIGRPSLFGFLDRLRDQRMTPEPKDYKTWRLQLADVERAASEGSYSEMWPLVDGRTFRVTGRPHHDGAVAFIFEDISSEVSLTRRFRAELEVGQAVLDSLDEAIAVFSPSGVLTMSNRAYAKLWDSDPMTSVNKDITFLDATRTWQKNCVPTPVWGDARDFASGIGDRADWTAEVRTRDGEPLACRFEPLAGGATLVGFNLIGPAVATSPVQDGKAESQPMTA